MYKHSLMTWIYLTKDLDEGRIEILQVTGQGISNTININGDHGLIEPM